MNNKNIDPTAIIFFKKGKEHFEKHKFELSISYFSDAIEYDSKFADAFFNRAMAKRELSHYRQQPSIINEAIEDFKSALNIDAKHIATLYQLSYTYAALGKHIEALKMIDIVNEIQPEWHSYRIRHNINMTLGNLEEAKLDEKKAWEIGHEFSVF
jgi:tetratricopeptide (TPR) repeat protein